MELAPRDGIFLHVASHIRDLFLLSRWKFSDLLSFKYLKFHFWKMKTMGANGSLLKKEGNQIIGFTIMLAENPAIIPVALFQTIWSS